MSLRNFVNDLGIFFNWNWMNWRIISTWINYLVGSIYLPMQFSPKIIGPDSAMIVALGWITQPLDTVMSPLSKLSSQTIAFAMIFMLNSEIRKCLKCMSHFYSHLLVFSSHYYILKIELEDESLSYSSRNVLRLTGIEILN